MVAQRRYSVTGQTPPDIVEAMKTHSPRPEALDTSMPPTSCGLCESVGDASIASIIRTASDEEAPEPGWRRKLAHASTAVRTSSKRSATQLPPSSSLATTYQPPKMARYCFVHDSRDLVGRGGGAGAGAGAGASENIDVDVDVDMDMDADTDEIVDIQTDLDAIGHASHYYASHALAWEGAHVAADDNDDGCMDDDNDDGCIDDGKDDECMDHGKDDGCMDDDNEDECMDDDATLSSSHSSDPSLDHSSVHPQQGRPSSLEASHKVIAGHVEPATCRVERVPRLPVEEPPHIPHTFLTLPPEIRHHIYRNCDHIVLHKPLVYCISTFQGEMQHPLASVSRLVRSEALAIFYSHNLWVIKVEFRIMYDAFQDWILRLGPGASLLRLIKFSVRGSLLKPRRAHAQSVTLDHDGQAAHATTTTTTTPDGTPAAAFENAPLLYSPLDGDASFHIDLSEKFLGGKVELLRNDGTVEAGEKALAYLSKIVADLWGKRQAGTLNGQDWINMVDDFISFVGAW